MSKRERVEDLPVLSNVNKKTKQLQQKYKRADVSNKENIAVDLGKAARLPSPKPHESPSLIDLNVKNIAENFEQILKHQGETKAPPAAAVVQKGRWVAKGVPIFSERVESIVREHNEEHSATLESLPANTSLDNIDVDVKSLAQKFSFDKLKGEHADLLPVSPGQIFRRTPGSKIATLQQSHTPITSRFKRVENIATPSQIFKSKGYGRRGTSRRDSRSEDRSRSMNRSLCTESEALMSQRKSPFKIHVDISNLREVFEKKDATKKEAVKKVVEETLVKKDAEDIVPSEVEAVEKDVEETLKKDAEDIVPIEVESSISDSDVGVQKIVVSEEAECDDTKIEEECGDEKTALAVPEIEAAKECAIDQDQLLVGAGRKDSIKKPCHVNVTPVILVTNDNGECIDRIECKAEVEPQKIVQERIVCDEQGDVKPSGDLVGITIEESDIIEEPGLEVMVEDDQESDDVQKDFNEEESVEVVSHVTLRKKSSNNKSQRVGDDDNMSMDTDNKELTARQKRECVVLDAPADTAELSIQQKRDCISSVSEGVMVFQKQTTEMASSARVEKRHAIAPRLAERLSCLSKNLENLGDFVGGGGGGKTISKTAAAGETVTSGQREELENVFTEDVFQSPERKICKQHEIKAVSPRVLKRCMDNSALCTDNIEVFDTVGKYDSLRSFDDDSCMATDRECKDEPTREIRTASKTSYVFDGGSIGEEYERGTPGKKTCLWNIKESTPVVNKKDVKFSVNLDSVTRAGNLGIEDSLGKTFPFSFSYQTYGDSAKLASDFSLPGEFSSCKGEISCFPTLTTLGSTADFSGRVLHTSYREHVRATSCNRNIKYFPEKANLSARKQSSLDEILKYNALVIDKETEVSFEEIYRRARVTLLVKDTITTKGQGESGVSDLDLSLDDLVEVNKDVLWRYHTQPVDSGQDAQTAGQDTEDHNTSNSSKPSEVELRRAKRLSSRHHTQPITPTEKEAVESLTDGSGAKMSGSIADRLSSLQQQGEHEWKKRIQRDSPSPTSSGSSSPSRLKDRQSKLLDKVTGDVKLRDKAAVLRSQDRPTSLADRMSCLEDAQTGWRKRVEDKDTGKFTVEGKMSGRVAASPLVDKRQTRANLNRELGSVLANGFASPSRKRMTVPPDVGLSPLKAELAQDDEAASTPNIPVSTNIVADSQELSSDSDENKENAVVEVPCADDETFQAFYSQVVLGQKLAPVTLDDLDVVESHQILSPAKRARPQYRQSRASKNPLKALAQRDDLKTEYEEYNTGVAEKELRRIKTDQIAGKACMATEALAGLATKESFDKVKLRKAQAAVGSPSAGGDRFLPYKELMLLQVKGRRACQCRLVSPTPHSINSGDCFILVTSNKVYVWLGDYCNVIEKSKAIDVAQTIQQKKDLGCKSFTDPCVIQEGKDCTSAGEEFWRLLGGRCKAQDPGPAEEDELYEMYLSETNMVYRIQGEHLVALKEQWGQVLKHQTLTDKEAFVFDFGSEVYVWTGKHVAFSERKTAMKLAMEIWGRGYDYSNCDINPLSSLQTEESGGLPLKSDSRPDWTLLGKVNQNMETILFKEKFVDWPDSSSKIIKMKEAEQDTKFEIVELMPCNVEEMLAPDSLPVDLVLEGSHIGRGDKWVETIDGIRREYEVVTIDIAVWHVLQYDHFLLDELSRGQFHDGDTFVIRWHYKVTQSGIKTLKGKEAAHSQTGREKCAYFFWQGKNSSITEKGASALMTVELDEERGPQLRVVQGKEPSCFIRLFAGRMSVHIGKREEEETNTQGDWKLYIVRNEIESEAYLLEVPPSVQNLRSRSSSILLNVKDGHMFIWHGAKSSKETRARASECAENIQKRIPLEFGISKEALCFITEIEEGSETARFRRSLGGSATWRKEEKPFHSLLKDKSSYTSTSRLFHTTSVSGLFVAKEIQNPSRCPEIVCPFPVCQSDLYKATQPALFLLDAGHVIYLWQGWWPEETEEVENVRTGSAESRLNSERIVAMETCLNYCKAKYPRCSRPCPSYLVFAGLEPLQFTNLFPTWEVDGDIQKAQMMEGRQDGEQIELSAYLRKLTQTKYSYEELLERPLPEGVDALRMEKYLHDDQFEAVLETSKEEFYKLPPWKQINLKKNKGLF